MKKQIPYGQVSGGRAGKAGAGRSAGKAPKRKPPKGGKASRVALAALTCVNLGLTVALHVLRRQDILHAVETDEGVKLLLTAEKRTKSEQD